MKESVTILNYHHLDRQKKRHCFVVLRTARQLNSVYDDEFFIKCHRRTPFRNLRSSGVGEFVKSAGNEYNQLVLKNADKLQKRS